MCPTCRAEIPIDRQRLDAAYRESDKKAGRVTPNAMLRKDEPEGEAGQSSLEAPCSSGTRGDKSEGETLTSTNLPGTDPNSVSTNDTKGDAENVIIKATVTDRTGGTPVSTMDRDKNPGDVPTGVASADADEPSSHTASSSRTKKDRSVEKKSKTVKDEAKQTRKKESVQAFQDFFRRLEQRHENLSDATSGSSFDKDTGAARSERHLKGMAAPSASRGDSSDTARIIADLLGGLAPPGSASAFSTNAGGGSFSDIPTRHTAQMDAQLFHIRNMMDQCSNVIAQLTQMQQFWAVQRAQVLQEASLPQQQREGVGMNSANGNLIGGGMPFTNGLQFPQMPLFTGGIAGSITNPDGSLLPITSTPTNLSGASPPPPGKSTFTATRNPGDENVLDKRGLMPGQPTVMKNIDSSVQPQQSNLHSNIFGDQSLCGMTPGVPGTMTNTCSSQSSGSIWNNTSQFSNFMAAQQNHANGGNSSIGGLSGVAANFHTMHPGYIGTMPPNTTPVANPNLSTMGAPSLQQHQDYGAASLLPNSICQRTAAGNNPQLFNSSRDVIFTSLGSSSEPFSAALPKTTEDAGPLSPNKSTTSNSEGLSQHMGMEGVGGGGINSTGEANALAELRKMHETKWKEQRDAAAEAAKDLSGVESADSTDVR